MINVLEFLNVIMGYDMYLDINVVKLIVKVFLSDKIFVIEEVFWIKNGENIDIERRERKYLKISIGNLFLIINDVN